MRARPDVHLSTTTMRYVIFSFLLLGLVTPAYATDASDSAGASTTCADGGPFGFEVGVYLLPGSPVVHLAVTDVFDDVVLWEGDLQTSQTVTGNSGCHWAAHVGEPAPPDPLRAERPAYRSLHFDFGGFIFGSFGTSSVGGRTPGRMPG